MKKIMCLVICMLFVFGCASIVSAASLELISPQSGDYLTDSDPIEIKWAQDDIERLVIQYQLCRQDAASDLNCSSMNYITDGVIEINSDDLEGSFSWQVKDYTQSGLYKIKIGGYAYSGTAEATYLEDETELYVILDIGDQDFSLLNSVNKNDIDPGNVIVDVGTNERYANGTSYFVQWRSSCESAYANVWLVGEVLEDGSEIVIPMSTFEWNHNTNALNLNKFTNNGLFFGRIPGVGDHKILMYPLPNDPVTGNFRHADILITRTPTGQYYAEQMANSVASLEDTYYKIRVDVHGVNCSATGLSRYIYSTAILNKPLPPLPQDDQEKIEPVGTPNDVPSGPERPDKYYSALAKRLRGKLLLQVEDKGRIWYVDPVNENKHEVTFANALNLFETLSLGISNADLNRIPINPDSVSEDKDGDGDGFSDKSEILHAWFQESVTPY